MAMWTRRWWLAGVLCCAVMGSSGPVARLTARRDRGDGGAQGMRLHLRLRGGSDEDDSSARNGSDEDDCFAPSTFGRSAMSRRTPSEQLHDPGAGAQAPEPCPPAEFIHSDPLVNEYRAMRSAYMQFETGAEQWAAHGYAQQSYWGGPCPAEQCRCRDPNAEPPFVPLPAGVHPSVMHEPACICPACEARRSRARELAPEIHREDAEHAAKAERSAEEVREAMKDDGGEDGGSVYSLHGAYNTDEVPDDIMGTADDPLTPFGISAAPPRAADELEEVMQQDLASRDMNDASNIEYLILYAQFLYDVRNDRDKASQLALKVRQLDPDNWWINMYSEKYLPEEWLQANNQAGTHGAQSGAGGDRIVGANGRDVAWEGEAPQRVSAGPGHGRGLDGSADVECSPIPPFAG